MLVLINRMGVFTIQLRFNYIVVAIKMQNYYISIFPNFRIYK